MARPFLLLALPTISARGGQAVARLEERILAGERGEKMKDAEMNCNCGHGHGKKYMLFGVLAIVYGIVNYLMSVMGWQPYMAWIAGGVILLLVSWAKGSMHS